MEKRGRGRFRYEKSCLGIPLMISLRVGCGTVSAEKIRRNKVVRLHIKSKVRPFRSVNTTNRRKNMVTNRAQKSQWYLKF